MPNINTRRVSNLKSIFVKLIGIDEVATQHFIYTHEECSPQISPF